MFIAVLFKIARIWKQLRWPSTDGRIKNLWYIYTIEYYSTIKSNKFKSVAVSWMHLESVSWSEVTQKEKDIVF